MTIYSEYICFDTNRYDSFHFHNCYLFHRIFLEIKNIYILNSNTLITIKQFFFICLTYKRYCLTELTLPMISKPSTMQKAMKTAVVTAETITSVIFA